ncbi:MAG: hypothetical protein NT018_00195 [Armatimonadetes bacterium]|nr:hypothetical protein [Armatimonadota bacterium]
MKLDKKQVSQLVVLGVLLIGGIGYVTFQLNSGGTPNARAKPAAKISLDNAPATRSETVEQMSGMIFPNLTTPVPRRDPFAAMARKLLPQDQTPAKQINPAIRKPPKSIGPNPFANSTRVPPLDIKLPGGSSATTEQVKEPEFALTGIIRGVENVAIIRSGQNGRYVVKQGALIEGRYRVISISQDSIMLENNGRLLRVKLGGVKNAS